LFAISAIFILRFLKSAGFLLTVTLLRKGVRSRADHQLLEQVWLAGCHGYWTELAADAGSWFTCLGYTQVAIADMTVAPMYLVNFLLSLS
jgi:hypothetical protein